MWSHTWRWWIATETEGSASRSLKRSYWGVSKTQGSKFTNDCRPRSWLFLFRQWDLAQLCILPGLGLKGRRLWGNLWFRTVNDSGFELFLPLLDEPLVAIFYLSLLLNADFTDAPSCFLCLLVVPQHPLLLLVLLSLELLDLQLFLHLLFLLQPFLLLLFALFLELMADVLFILDLLLEHFDGLELLTH